MAISSFLSVNKTNASRKKSHTATWLVRQQHRKLQTSSKIKRGDLVVPICQQKRRIKKKSHTASWLVRQQHRKIQTSSEIEARRSRRYLSVNKRDALGKRVTRRLGSSANNIVSYKLPPRSSGAISSFLSVNKRDASRKKESHGDLARPPTTT